MPQGHPPYAVTVKVQGYCYAGGIGIVFTVRGGYLAHDLLPLLHLGPPRGMALCRFVRPTSAVTQILSSPLIGVLHALLGMNSENKHRMKDGKTRDISQRNTMAGLFPVSSFQQFSSFHHRHTHASLQWTGLSRAAPFPGQKHE